MIILIIGKPGVGKSTLIAKIIDRHQGSVSWVVTKEIRDEQGNRVGFSATDSQGKTEIISHKTDIQSDIVIGQNKVDLEKVDRMFAAALGEPVKSGTLVIVDEVGPIQLLSDQFAAAFNNLFSHSHKGNLLATIHYSDKRLAPYRSSEDACLFELTTENRDVLPDIILLLLNDLNAINKLSKQQIQCLYALVSSYFKELKILQIEKLLLNAIYYVNDNLIEQINDEHWTVSGKHGAYEVRSRKEILSCNCDLFNGRGKYTGKAGECSHIQAVKLHVADVT